MIRPLNELPNLDNVKAAFPDIDVRRAVITYYPDIYTDNRLSPDLEHHETVHLAQQSQYKGGPSAWWDRYLTDSQFVKEQESEAYRQQGRYIRKFMADRNQRARTLRQLEIDFSGPFYNNCVSSEEAHNIIKNG